MKILVVSDTHKETEKLEALLERYVNEVRLVCHLGDHAHDLLQFESRYPQLTMVAVAGNCDYPHVERERLLVLTACADRSASGEAVAEKRILLTHGHNLGVKIGLDRLCYYAREKGADAVFYGHTHFPVATTHGGIFVMNPGSPSEPRGGSKASYGTVEISPKGELTGKLHAVPLGRLPENRPFASKHLTNHHI